MQKEAQQHEVEQQGKRHYDKPAMSVVRLFADNVLNICSSDEFCQPDPLKISGN